MKIVSRIFLMFIAVAIMSSCQSRYSDYTIQKDVFESEQKGIAVMKMYKNTLVKTKIPVNFDIVRVDQGYDKYKAKETTAYRATYKLFSLENSLEGPQMAMMIEPGIYIIENLSWYERNKIYSSKEPGISNDGKITYGAFEVKPNEVVYIGDFEVNNVGLIFMKIDMKRHHKFEKAKKQMSKKYPGFAEKLTTTKFLEQGESW